MNRAEKTITVFPCIVLNASVVEIHGKVLPVAGMKVWYHFGSLVIPGVIDRVRDEMRGLVDIELMSGSFKLKDGLRFMIDWEPKPGGLYWTERD